MQQKDLRSVQLAMSLGFHSSFQEECTRFAVPLAQSSTHCSSAKLFFKHNEQLSDLSDLRSS